MSQKTISCLFAFLFIALPLQGQTNICNIESRTGTSLCGKWQAIVDPYESGYYDYRHEPKDNGYFKNQKPASKSDLIEYDFDKSGLLVVPGDWNSQRENLLFYEGTIWYKKSFDYELHPSRRVFLCFDAANYNAVAYLNGEKLGEHTGGFTPFSFEITGGLREKDNFVVVKVDNKRHREGVPTDNTDWWNYGGLTRDVRIIDVPSTFIRDYFLQLDPDSSGVVAGWIQLDGKQQRQKIAVEIPDAGIVFRTETDGSGRCTVRFPAKLEFWSPENPKRYEVRLLAETDSVSDLIGFRTIAVRGSEILLNGNPVFLRGISIHEEAPLRGGRASTPEDARILLGWAKELGCNFVRLAHYPHNEHMIREAEKMGILVWSEIPVYWTILWSNSTTYALAEQQLTEMISRDKNRAPVIIWSVANETPRSPERLEFLGRLIDKARQLDTTRLISAATELTVHGSDVIIDDSLSEKLDVIGANEYFGWYVGKPDEIPAKKWSTKYNKPVVMTEFGGDALQGLHGAPDERWTEEYQATLYTYQIGMLRTIPFLRGISPWLLTDFRSPRRPLPGIQDFWNRKGLISDKGMKKAAFSILKAFYEEKRQEVLPPP